jgi:hypothetical protein
MVILNMVSKAQSSVEYLTTYGWTILAVTAVSTIAYASIQSSCTRSFSDFYTDTIEVDDFGMEDSSLVISVENTGYSDLQFKSINVSVRENHEYKNLDINVSSGDSDKISVSGFNTIEACNVLDVKMKFDRGDLNDQEVTGLIRAPIDIE